MLPAHALNESFLDMLDNEKEKLTNVARTYITRTAQEQYPNVRDLAIELDKTANAVKLSISASIDSRAVTGYRLWSQQELRTSKRPITHHISDLMADMFRDTTSE